MKIIFDYNRTLYDPETKQLFPGVLPLLEKLAKKHHLYLISKAEFGREYQLEAFGLAPLFKRIMLISTKTTEVFRTLVDHHDDVLVVGDRVRDEIRIAKELRYKTVWIQQGFFRKEIPRNNREEPDHIVRNVPQLSKLLLEYGR